MVGSALLVLFTAGCAGSQAVPAQPAADGGRPPVAVGTVLDGPVPPHLLDLPLVDEHGRVRTLGALRGKVVVVADMLTQCQETCAVGTASLVQAARVLAGTDLAPRVELVSVTLDPARDDPRHLAAYRRAFGAPATWDTLTGSPADVAALWDGLGIWRHRVRLDRPWPRDWVTGTPLRYDVQHTDDLVFIGPDRRFRYVVDGPGSVPSRRLVPDRIYRFMSAQGRRDVRTPGAGSWSVADVVRVVRWLVQGEGERS